MGNHRLDKYFGPASHQSNLKPPYHDIENAIRNQSNTALMCDSHCKRSGASIETSLQILIRVQWLLLGPCMASRRKQAEATNHAKGQAGQG